MTVPPASTLVYLFAAAGIVGIGVYGLLLADHLMRKLLALNLLGGGVFLLMVTLAAPGPVPGGAPDPIPHALVITGLVIAVSATAFALALMERLHRETGRLELDDDEDGH